MHDDPFDYVDVQEAWRLALKEAHTVIAQSGEAKALERDPEQKQKLIRLVAENVMIEQGIVPRSFVYSGRCRRCGDVPLDSPVVGEVLGCPWCASGSRPTIYIFNHDD